jgi:2-oxo-3-hexenedioate decarboxylase
LASDTVAIAQRLIAAYDARTLIDPITASDAEFDTAAAYTVLHLIEADRHARGWRPVGRKIGFTNRTIWELYGVRGPMWARMWDRTVHFASEGHASLSLDSLLQPRIEPEVVFRLSSSIPSSDDSETLLSCVEWMAAGFEIVYCPFPGWRFAAPDSTAAFGLHGALVVGTPVAVTAANRASIAALLGSFDVELSCDDAVVERGNGDNVLGSPAQALGYLARTVADQTQFEAADVGEVVTTGTLTDARVIAPGERWHTNYGALGVEGLSLELR